MPDIMIPINKTVDISQGALLTTLGLLNTKNQMIQGQSYAHQLNVSVTNAGTPVVLSGACTAEFLRQSDSSTVTVAGTISNNVASVVFPPMVYSFSGMLTITLFVGGTTILQIETSVRQSGTMAIVDPGNTLPNVVEIQQTMMEAEQALNQLAPTIASAQAATSQANAAASNANAAASAINSVTVGQVNTLDSTQNASASVILQNGAWSFIFGLPRGLTGPAGGEGNTVPMTAQELESKSASELAALYTSGAKWLQVKNNDTVVCLALNGDGSTSFQTTNMPQRNFLDNPTFEIAQAGYNGYHGSTKYLTDRWPTTNANVSIAGNTITYNGQGEYPEPTNIIITLQKVLNAQDLIGKQVTFAVNVSNISVPDGVNFFMSDGAFASPETTSNVAISSGINTYSFTVGTQVSNDSSISIWLPVQANTSITASITIEWAALYIGSYTPQTLPIFESPDKAVSLLKCCECYEVINNFWGMSTGSKGFEYFVQFKTNKRIVPTVTVFSVQTGASGVIDEFNGSQWIQSAANFIPYENGVRVYGQTQESYNTINFRLSASADL